MLRFLISSLLLILYSIPLLSQNIEIKGTITDTLRNPLSYANILALPENDEKKVRFAISGNNGNYSLKLDRDQKYHIEISYLGYVKIIDSLFAMKDDFLDFKLKPSNNLLDEVTISSRTPIIIRKDTILYRPEKFLSGNERKLKDVLKKLPGIDVDRDGNVKVNGKPVTKLLIEGKQFFTGDEKLGVNNIPADVIDEIEALDNYTSVAFLKGLSDSNQLALNIKLKDGKKKFVFGEVEAGAGIEERYLVTPTTFYYSPKTSVYAIGDFNNVGKKSFTTEDYVNFEGGYERMLDNPSSYTKLLYNDFSKFLTDTDFIFNKNNLAAASLDKTLSPKLTFSAYSILYDGRIIKEENNSIDYFINNDLNELRSTKSNKDFQFTLSKATLRYIGYSKIDVSYEAFLKTNKANTERDIQSRFLTDSTFANQQSRPKNTDFTQNLTIDKKFSKSVTSSLTINYKYLNATEDNFWNFNSPVFSNTLPFSDQEISNLVKQKNTNRINDFKVNLKNYWIINRNHHLYPQFGISSLFQNFSSTSEILEDQTTTSLSTAGFNNDLDYRLTDIYFGLDYKLKAGNFIVQPGVFYHYYVQNIVQFENELVNEEKVVLLPRFDITWEPSGSQKIRFKYKLVSSFGEASQLANRRRLIDFNRIFIGNEKLENELYHAANINYSNFSLLTGNLWVAALGYRNNIQSIRRSTVLNNIEQSETLLYTSLPENNYNGIFQYTKILPDYEFNVALNGGILDYQRTINESLQEFSSTTFGYNVGALTNFKDFPNIEIQWKQDFSTFKSIVNTTDFVVSSPSVNVDLIIFKDLSFKGTYSYNYYKNKSTDRADIFQIAEASLYYNKENNPFTLSLNIQNIFNTQFKNVNSSSEFLLGDQQIFIQPRVATLSLAYKF